MLDELILVTNAASHIGSHIIKQLLQNGYLVRGVLSHKDASASSTSLRALIELCAERRDRLELVQVGDMHHLDLSSCRILVAGCGYVIHVASTEPLDGLQHADDKAFGMCRQSTLNLLQACQEDGRIEKVVLTGSCLAVHDLFDNQHAARTAHHADQARGTPSVIDNADGDGDHAKSGELMMLRQTLSITTENQSRNFTRDAHIFPPATHSAERSAWDYVHSLNKTVRFSLTTILPTLVLGPVLHRGQHIGLGKTITQYLIHRKLNFLPVPNLMLPVCDVRDVALAHVRALENGESDGMRVLVSSSTVGLGDLADSVHRVLEPLNYNVNAKRAGSPLMAKVSLMLSGNELKRFGNADLLHRTIVYDNTRMRMLFKFEPILEDKSIIDMADSLIQRGDIQLTERYAAVMSQKPEANYFHHHELGSVMAGDDEALTYINSTNNNSNGDKRISAAREAREIDQPEHMNGIAPKPRKKWFSGTRQFSVNKADSRPTSAAANNEDDMSVIPA